MARKSVYRYNSIIAVGCPDAQDTADGAVATFTFDPDEAARLGKLVIQAETTLAGCQVQQIKVNNDDLISGDVPAEVFAHDSFLSPPFGHAIDQSSKIVVKVINESGATQFLSCGFTASDMEDGGPKVPSRYRGGRTFVAAGGPAQTSIAATTEGTLTWTFSEDNTLLNQLVLECITGSLQACTVTQAKLNNDDLISDQVPATVFARDSLSNPLGGYRVGPKDTFVLKIQNDDGANAALVAGAWIAG
jgi:hypothetical protein